MEDTVELIAMLNGSMASKNSPCLTFWAAQTAIALLDAKVVLNFPTQQVPYTVVCSILLRGPIEIVGPISTYNITLIERMLLYILVAMQHYRQKEHHHHQHDEPVSPIIVVAIVMVVVFTGRGQ